MRNLGLTIGITIFLMAFAALAWGFLMRVYNDYRKDKARELEFLNRKEEYKANQTTKSKR